MSGQGVLCLLGVFCQLGAVTTRIFNIIKAWSFRHKVETSNGHSLLNDQATAVYLDSDSAKPLIREIL